MTAAVSRQSVTDRLRKRHTLDIDRFLLLLTLALLTFGLVMVTSASLHLGDSFGSPFHYAWKHLFSIFLGLSGGLLIMSIHSNHWERYSTGLYFLGLLLLIVVLIPGIGKTVNGATRWIPLGVFNFQSSEFMKLFLVLYLAGYLVRRQVEVRYSVKGFIIPIVLLGIASALTLVQPDFGTTTVMLVTALGLLFLGGTPLWQFMLLILPVGGLLASLVIMSPYRMARITGFMDPWADVNNSGYQLAQALIAFGRGEWTGVGLGNGIQKQFYLPEAHTDFLISVVGEEFGLLGTVAVILMLSLFVWRAFSIGTKAMLLGRRFAAYVCFGFAIWIGFQAFINIGVNLGLLPTKGITLPFMSYGGNSIIVACLILAMLLRIDRENRQAEMDESKGRKVWQAV